MNIRKWGAVALAAAALAVTNPALAKHHSNTLKHLGNAIQYPIRKAANNTSVDVHRALHHKSVVRRHYGHYHHNAVVTPSGHLKPVHHSMRRMSRMGGNYTRGNRRYYTYRGHQYYMNTMTHARHRVR